MDSRWETDELADLISRKHDVLEQMRHLTEQQMAIIRDGAMHRLLGILSAKQDLLQQIHSIENHLRPFRDQDPDQRLWRSPHARQQCQRIAQRCQVLLEEIMVTEKQCETNLIQRRDETARKLQGVHDARRARQAYTQDSYPRRHHLDLTSED